MSVLAAIIPMVLYLIVIWKMDKYEPEPIKFVLQHFFWGAFGAVFFGIIGSEIFSSQISVFIDDIEYLSFLETVAIAPIVEEIAKGIFLFATINSKKFDNLTDGLVYGGAIGLGFGMTENFLYFLAYGDTIEAWLYLVIIRSGFSAVMHCMSTATLGAFFGIAKFSGKKTRYFYGLVGLVIAILIHFLWNFSVSFQNTFSFGVFMIFAIVLIFFIIYRVSLKHEEIIIKIELEDEAEKHLLPLSYIEILSSQKRFKKGWINELIRKRFTKLATKLAFLKHEGKKYSGIKKEENEILILQHRLDMQDLLKSNSAFIELED